MLQAVSSLFKGHSFINAATYVVTMHLIRRWWLIYSDISPPLHFLVSSSSLGFLSRSTVGLSGDSRGMFAPRWVVLFIFSSLGFGPQVKPRSDVCMAPFFLIGLGP